DILHLSNIVEEIGNSNCKITEEMCTGYVEQKNSLYYSLPNAQNLLASMLGLIAEVKMKVIEDL
ncbi:986_t:CDS:2, partial [Funneliformis geosporum]